MDMRRYPRRDRTRTARQELAATQVRLLALGSTGRLTDLPHAAPSMGQRLRVRFSRWRLDREIAMDGPVPGTALHLLRVAQLAEPRTRHQVAVRLRGVVDDAMLPYVRLNAVPLRRAEVLAWREGLLGLADWLDNRGPVSPRGVARARVLITDGTGPLYNPKATRMTSRRDDLVDRRRLTAGF